MFGSFLFALLLGALVHPSLSKRPNVLFFLLDDLGFADASFNARRMNVAKPPIETPNIDQLASEGVVFTRHYTHFVCAPTRGALLTSQYSWRLSNFFPTFTGEGSLKPTPHTVVHEFRDRGYRTHLVGKYGIDNQGRIYNSHVGRWVPSPRRDDVLGPLSRGFDTFYGFYLSIHDHFKKSLMGFPDWHLFNETHLMSHPHPDLDLQVDKSSTQVFTEKALEIMAQHKKSGQPFFLELAYSMPHDPLMVEDRYRDFPSCAKMTNEMRKTYCGMVSSVDERIGKIVGYLRQSGQLEETILVFTSDNGGWPIAGGFNYPLRSSKATVYEGGVRTVAFVRMPSMLCSGREYEELFHITDWGPTLLSMSDAYNGEEGPLKHDMEDIDGMDLFASLSQTCGKRQGEKNAAKRDELLVDSLPFLNSTAYISGNYKLLIGALGAYETYQESALEDSWTNRHCIIHPNQRDFAWAFHCLNFNFVHWFRHFTGIDLYIIKYALMGRVFGLRDALRGTQSNNMRRGHPLGPLTHALEFRDFVIPDINWEEAKEKMSQKTIPEEYWLLDASIQLYDIVKDPGELNNLAFQPEYKGQVEEMVGRVQEILSTAPPDAAAGLMFLQQTATLIVRFVCGILVALIFAAIACCYCVCRGCRSSKSAQVADKEKDD